LLPHAGRLGEAQPV
jgi:hypothetical protein